MRPSLQQLESFYWVARLGSVHAAARHQNLTQPAVTARLRELEDIVGEQLFDRGGYKLGLKPRGRELFGLAEQILKLAERFSGARPEDAPGLGLLRLGANESSAMIGLSTFLARLKLLFPKLRVELQVDIGTELSRRLNARELDMAILSSPMSAAHIVDEPLGSVDLQWVAPRSFRPPVRVPGPQDLAHCTVLNLVAPSSLQSATVNWFGPHAAIVPAGGSCNSIALIQKLVADGHGIAIVPGPMAREAAASSALKILKVNPAVPPINYFVSYLQELAPAAREQIVPLAREVFIDCGLIRPRA
ncbi:LysR family transcriptional regulator [Herbaspirillum sp. alder98]|uniref:LysR family transcriptional regulator n=1 Tax=Herbaspirillum sp. alder98 TaxID=2913096 RepID=UPI001CD831A9|nr:LysR family transcriptional regulator [Herbaspirillum sp. alder98]MCA1326534.1 LysR family transcriptional regulator [Herbaspirillum sp. alder98]